MRRFIIFTLMLGFFSCTGQNTKSFTEGMTSPKATLTDASWIQGHWLGEAFGGIAEEIWAPPLGDSMMFVFKLVNDNKVSFYEIGHIQQQGETLLMQLKHFHGDLKGWEEREETVDFKLVKFEDGKLFFDGLTFERISDTEMNVYVVVGEEDGSTQEVKFNYKKQKS